MKTINIISRGVALCKRDPSPMSRLEGFGEGDKYMFERCETLTSHSEDEHLPMGMKYIRVYDAPMNPDEEMPLNFSPPFSYETIGISTFKKCFAICTELAI